MAIRSVSESTSNNGYEQAAAYVNIYVELADGSEIKLSGAPLKNSIEIQKAIIEKGTLDGLKVRTEVNVVRERTKASEFKFATA